METSESPLRENGGTRESGEGDSAPPGVQIGENGIFGRPKNSNEDQSIDIPANGDKPHETLHYDQQKILNLKQYNETSCKNYKYELNCKYNGISEKEFKKLIFKNHIVAYGLPKNQALKCVWSFRLYLSSGEILILSSKCSSVGGWDEVGYLSIDFKENVDDLNSDKFIKTTIESFRVIDFALLIYDERDIYSEAGICFYDDLGSKIIGIAAPAPGALTIRMPNIKNEFEPEFLISDYQIKIQNKGITS